MADEFKLYGPIMIEASKLGARLFRNHVGGGPSHESDYILLKRIEYPMRLSREQAIRMADKLWNLAVECPTLDEYLNPPTRGG